MLKKYLSWFGVWRVSIISINGLILSVTEMANIGIFIAYISSFSVDKQVMRFYDIFQYSDSIDFILFCVLVIFGGFARVLLFNNFRKIVREVTKDLFSSVVFSEQKGIERQRSKLVYANQGVRSFAQICAGFFYCIIGIILILVSFKADTVITMFIISLFVILVYIYSVYSNRVFSRISNSLNDNLETLATTTTNEALEAAKSATDYQATINMKNQSLTIFAQNSIYLCLGALIFWFGEIGAIDVLGLILMISRLTPKLLELLRGLNVLSSISRIIT